MILPEARIAQAEQALQDPRRLEVVRSTELLDTPFEEEFDSLSRLAATLVGAPAGYLSIVDDGRDFYKSHSGLPEPLASSRQLSGHTFCHYAIVNPEPLVIDDTYEHPVWRAVPTVDSLGVRAYLGVPLIVAGQPIGNFCVIDTRPRSWTTIEIDTIVQLSRSAVREIELRRLLKEARIDAELAHALTRANEQLIAVIAHDLRTPLNVIGLSTELLARVVDAPILPQIDRLAGAVSAMKRLVDELFSTHAAKTPALTRRAIISTEKLLADAADTMKLVANNAHLSISIDAGAGGMVAVDYSQMLRVMCNVISNCVKYCPAGSAVLLRASQNENDVIICVSDNGPGMSAEDQTHAFERGWQKTARQDGAGLGLAIVRELVEQNDGEVSLNSELSMGTSIIIRLPIAAQPVTTKTFTDG
jgi:signal transduction histidine kinase